MSSKMNWKAAGIKPMFKKEDPLNKENYRSVSVLPTMSKILETVLFNRFTQSPNNFISLLLCGFRKGYSSQYAPLTYFKNGRKVLANLTEFLALC